MMQHEHRTLNRSEPEGSVARIDGDDLDGERGIRQVGGHREGDASLRGRRDARRNDGLACGQLAEGGAHDGDGLRHGEGLGNVGGS